MVPLAGQRVVVTRAAHQATALLARLEEAGAQVEALALLEVVAPGDGRPLERAATELALYDWVVFTSSNAVTALMQAAGSLPQRLHIAAVGTATALALAEYDVEAELVPAERRAEGLVAELAPRVSRRQRVLLPQAADARPTLEKGLREAGADVIRVDAYRKRTPRDAPRRAAELFGNSEDWGWVTFASPSTVRGLAEVMPERWVDAPAKLLAASIGPVTSAELRTHGIEPRATAPSPTDQDLVAAIVAAAT
ncbi:MAG: uroporphyrinogen-III synthase [Acidobacteriota bacterium]|nr:uroporphyrinogen-III synthase [Acidobacteriota bacterium]